MGIISNLARDVAPLISLTRYRMRLDLAETTSKRPPSSLDRGARLHLAPVRKEIALRAQKPQFGLA